MLISQRAKERAAERQDVQSHDDAQRDFAWQHKICPICGGDLRSMNSDFSMKWDLLVCELDNKTWQKRN